MKKSGKIKSSPIRVACAADEGYAPYLSAMLESLAVNLDPEGRADVTVMHAGLSDAVLAELERSSSAKMSVRCLNVSDRLEPYRGYTYSTSYLTKEMYCRALIPEIFASDDRVIYLDCDLSVLSDLSELYDTDMQGCAAMGAKNPMHPKMEKYVKGLGLDPERYVNSGVLLLDCAKLRAMHFTERFFSLLSEREELAFPDQDVLNILLEGNLGYLAPEWNYLWHMERLYTSASPALRMAPHEMELYRRVYDRAKIVHYSGDVKPWMADAIKGAEHFIRYAALCPMRDRIASIRRAALVGEEKVKLVFLDFEAGGIALTCAHVLPRSFSPKPLKFCLNGTDRKPEIYFERECSSRGIGMVWRMFKINLPLPTEEHGSELSFSFGSERLLFEYEKFFPLNGYRESYFAHRGILLYRVGRLLRIESCTLPKRLSHELKYLAALVKNGGLKGVKRAALRIAYPIIRRILPKHIWLISDRPETAGDNGEALFRYLSAQAPRGISPYFVIRRSSPDFRRLKRWGRVIAAGSVRHKLYSLVAEVKAVSQTDVELYSPIDPRSFKDILAKQYRVFLQHGVTKDDISSAYSRFAHGFDLFITAAYPEYFSIIENPRYGLDARRVALTGFPRHDLLSGKRERIILVCPTWRSYLLPGGIADRELFRSSEYYSAWHRLLSEGALPDLAERCGYRIVLLPHRNTAPYLSEFGDISPRVEIASASYAELISRASLMITDFSSVAFEMGYLVRPVIYYTFDERDFFTRHTCREGYFDPERDGFGEVAKTEREVLGAVEAVLSSGCTLPPEKAALADGFFAYRGGGNSARVTEAIERLSDGD